jgi:RimJ/RimL family protein N-acetyltransferase
MTGATSDAWTIALPDVGAPALAFTPAAPDTHAELLHGWFAQPHVLPWWGGERSLPDTEAYLVRQCALPHLVPWVVSEADTGRPFGYVETYRAAEDPLARHHPLLPSDRGWHVLVGPPEVLGTGLPRLLGRAVLARLLTEDGIDRVVCEPNERNARMIGYCAGLGYRVLAALDLPDKRALLLTYERAAFDERWPGDLAAGLASRTRSGEHVAI